MEHRLKLVKNTGEAVDATRYRSIIGSLRYLVNTRPDIAYAVGVASRFMEAPGKQHWAIIRQILRYVRGTLNYGCPYKAGKGTGLTGFSDSDHAGDLTDRKSTTGLVFFMGPSVITWSSQKQKIVALSSCEAEYIAAATQAVWLRELVSEMLGTGKQKVQLKIDNKSAIEVNKNLVHHERSKHIDLRYHYIRECVEERKVEVEHVRTKDQLADILTKSLGRAKFTELRCRLGIIQVK
ncbi:secreted RxLR effector protein 161-like [Aegilops tauschii subsp. strangulata]|uniref:secreted RxLR effector protein 161-like n=1 Tax=Aegilops tauschii subsp. strangulata TaxID=200361 RepID=UPI001ABC3FA7|nr:secreted RxLR effector protein 161-like [Aegilops tauschii subsp. strangulata]